MRRQFRFAGFICLGLGGVTLMGCGGTAPTTAPEKAATATASVYSKEVKTLLDKAVNSLQQRQWQPALQTLNEAIKLDPQCGDAYFHRASLLADAGQAAAAVEDFSRAIQLSPNDAKLVHTRGFFLMTQQKVDFAINDFTKAIELNPKYPQAYNNRGLALLSKGNLEQAMSDFEQALSIDPKYAEALINRGFTLYRSGKPKQALTDYNQALKFNPDNVSALNNRGLAYFELKDYERAAADFGQAIARDSYNSKFYLERRECWLKLGRDEEAQTDADKIAWLNKFNQLNQTVSREPKVPAKYVELAEHLLAGGEQKVALASYEAAIRVNKDYGRSYSSRAAYWLSQQDYDKAIADCSRALKAEPHFEAYSIRGDAHFQKGEFASAIADYKKAKRLDVQVAQAYLSRAKELRTEGQAAEAAKYIKQAYEIEPSLRSGG